MKITLSQFYLSIPDSIFRPFIWIKENKKVTKKLNLYPRFINVDKLISSTCSLNSPAVLWVCSGPGAAGCLPGPVHVGWRCCPRGHQPHSETTQEGGTIISFTLLALETRLTHNTLLMNFTIQCLMNRIRHIWNGLPAHVIRAAGVSKTCHWSSLRSCTGRQNKTKWVMCDSSAGERKLTEYEKH